MPSRIDDRASIALGAGDTLSLSVLIFSDHPETLVSRVQRASGRSGVR